MSMTAIWDHLVFKYGGSVGAVGWDYTDWIELDNKSKCTYEFVEGGKVHVDDRVEDCFACLDCKSSGAGLMRLLRLL